MGILALMNLINSKCNNSIRQVSLGYLTGKIVACDASLAMY